MRVGSDVDGLLVAHPDKPLICGSVRGEQAEDEFVSVFLCVCGGGRGLRRVKVGLHGTLMHSHVNIACGD